MYETYYSKAERTLNIVRDILNDIDFYIFGSFARKQFDSSIMYNKNSDLDVLVDKKDFYSSIQNFENIRGVSSKVSPIEFPNENIFEQRSPNSVFLNSSKIILPSCTLIHLIELPNMDEAISSWAYPKIKTKDNIKYLILPEKEEITDFDRQIWQHNFFHYK